MSKILKVLVLHPRDMITESEWSMLQKCFPGYTIDFYHEHGHMKFSLPARAHPWLIHMYQPDVIFFPTERSSLRTFFGGEFSADTRISPVLGRALGFRSASFFSEEYIIPIKTNT